MIIEIEYPPRGTFKTVSSPLHLSGSPVKVMRPPMLGEHTAQLLEELCDVDARTLAKLRRT